MSPRERAVDNRNWVYEQGGRLTNDSLDRGATARQHGSYYNDYADQAYHPLLNNQGGYTEAERESIMREGQLNDARTGEEELNSRYLSPEEQAATAGNPRTAFDYFDPVTMEQAYHASAGWQRGAVDDMDQRMSDAVPIDQLLTSDDYYRNLEDSVRGAESGVRGAISRDRLAMDPTLADRYRLTPEQQQRMVTGAGITVGTGYQSAIDQMERQGRAAGIDPLGVAAMRGRLERQSAADAGDAMTQARIKADAERARREMDLEKERRAGETNYADMAATAEMQMGRERNQVIGNMEDKRLGSHRDVSNRRLGVAESVGRTRLGSEQNLANQENRMREYTTNTGIGLAQGVDDRQADRARWQAANRQDTQRNIGDTRYQQGVGVNDRLSGRSLQISDGRRQDAAEGRGYVREQIAGNRNTEQQEANRQLGIYGTQGGLANQSNQNEIIADSRPSTWERIAGAAAGGLGAAAGAGFRFEHGGVVTEPTVALLGEAGPEMVVPMNPDAQSKVTPTTAQKALGSGSVAPGSVAPAAPVARPAPAPVAPLYGSAPLAGQPMNPTTHGQQPMSGMPRQRAQQMRYPRPRPAAPYGGGGGGGLMGGRVA